MLSCRKPVTSAKETSAANSLLTCLVLIGILVSSKQLVTNELCSVCPCAHSRSSKNTHEEVAVLLRRYEKDLCSLKRKT